MELVLELDSNSSGACSDVFSEDFKALVKRSVDHQSRRHPGAHDLFVLSDLLEEIANDARDETRMCAQGAERLSTELNELVPEILKR